MVDRQIIINKEPSIVSISGTPLGTLFSKDIILGTGKETSNETSTLTVNYVLYLYKTGKQPKPIESNYGKEGATFPLTGIIPGWQEGLPGMKVGGRRVLIIPPELAYGSQGSGSVGPNETLIFIIDLLEISSASNLLNSMLGMPANSTSDTTFILNNHTATRLNNGKVLVVGGTYERSYRTLRLSVCDIFDPETVSWTSTDEMNTSRDFHTATRLTDGKILVVGGSMAEGETIVASSSCEIYDDDTKTWTLTGTMKTARFIHTATLLLDGKVLVTGGINRNFKPVASCEIYDPELKIWTRTGTMKNARYGQTAVLLKNGKVLVAGSAETSCEIYDPETKVWTETGPMMTARFGCTAVLLRDGKVLVAGGTVGSTTLASCEIYDGKTWTVTEPMKTPRAGNKAVLLQNGKVLVTGGSPDKKTGLASCEIYDPASKTWTVTRSMKTARGAHTATLLRDGKILINGGSVEKFSEIYDSETDVWTVSGKINILLVGHTSTQLENGRVLIAGGTFDAENEEAYLADCEIYDGKTGVTRLTGMMTTRRIAHTATRFANGKVLVTGGTKGSDGETILASCEIYDGKTETWTLTGAMNTARAYHTATALEDGNILVAGGGADSEIYDVNSGKWTVTQAMKTARSYHTAVLLPDGSVLVIGGSSENDTTLASCEIYDGKTGTWTPTKPMNTARYIHTATQLEDGKVLVTGGRDGETILASCEIYDGKTQTWTVLPAMTTARYVHTATLLPDGKVLVTGSSRSLNSFRSVASCEIYDGKTWTLTKPMTTPRSAHTATLLEGGKVLVVGYGKEIYDSETGVWNSSSLQDKNKIQNEIQNEIYDPVTKTWASARGIARFNHTATLLLDGRVIVAGGVVANTDFTAVTFPDCEIYDPTSGIWTLTGAITTKRIRQTATLLKDGKVLLIGGADSKGPLASCEIYDGKMWSLTGTMNTPRFLGHIATRLENGKILVTGGLINSKSTSNSLFDLGEKTSRCELFDSKTGIWTLTGPMTSARNFHTAVLLLDGKVLVTGGSKSSVRTILSSCEIYDSETGVWTLTGTMNTTRFLHTATRLSDGKILVAGGSDGETALASCEIYDPMTGVWISTGALTNSTFSHTASLLLDGKVLVAGGFSFSTAGEAICEIYDPATQLWTVTENISNRVFHTSVVLEDGKVLVVGGGDSRLFSS